MAPGLAADTWGHCCSAWLFVGSPASPPFLLIPSVPHQALTVINRKSAAGRPVSFRAKQLELWLQPAIPRLRQSSHLRVPSLIYLVMYLTPLGEPLPFNLKTIYQALATSPSQMTKHRGSVTRITCSRSYYKTSSDHSSPALEWLRTCVPGSTSLRGRAPQRSQVCEINREARSMAATNCRQKSLSFAHF